MIPPWTIGALYHASYIWHAAAAYIKIRSPSVTLALHFFFMTGNIFNFFSFKMLKRCLLISYSVKYRAPGSWPRERAVANATAYTPQSLLPHCFCMSTSCNIIWGFGVFTREASWRYVVVVRHWYLLSCTLTTLLLKPQSCSIWRSVEYMVITPKQRVMRRL